jgi:PhnB protein
MSFSAYLSFTGNAREAMTTYADIFGATDLQLMPFAQMPGGQIPPGAENWIMHAQFSAGPGAPLMGADMPMNPEGGLGNPKVFHGATDPARAAAIFARLSDGGDVILPLGETFWSPCFGMVKDRFGISWLISLAA